MHTFNWLTLCLLMLGTPPGDDTQSPAAGDPECQRVLEQLSSDDIGVVLSELMRLDVARRERKLSVKQGLIELVDSSTPDIQRMAIERLGEIGPGAADVLPILKARLDDPEPGVRLAAARAVWQVSQRTDLTIPVLLSLMSSDDPWFWLNVKPSGRPPSMH